MHQSIDKPTNVSREGMPCIDLIIEDQPHIFVKSGLHLSLDAHCPNQVGYGKLDVNIPPPQPYPKTIWHYSKSNGRAIIYTFASISWIPTFSTMGPKEMTTVFTNEILSITPA